MQLSLVLQFVVERLGWRLGGIISGSANHIDYEGMNGRLGNWKASGKAKEALGRGGIMWGFGYSEPIRGSLALL